MKSVDTGYTPPPGNPLVVNGYLVYGHGQPTKDGAGFEAWYWIAQPTDAEKWETVAKSRFGQDVYESRGKAEVYALQYGQYQATELPTGRFQR